MYSNVELYQKLTHGLWSSVWTSTFWLIVETHRLENITF